MIGVSVTSPAYNAITYGNYNYGIHITDGTYQVRDGNYNPVCVINTQESYIYYNEVDYDDHYVYINN